MMRTTWAPLLFVSLLACTRASDFDEVNAGPAGRFLVTGNVAVDTRTNLWWQRSPLARDSLAAAQDACGGLTDKDKAWRVPSVKELNSLVNRRHASGRDINVFPNHALPKEMWTSSVVDGQRVWIVDLSSKMTTSTAENRARSVYCVTGPSPWKDP